MRTLIISTQEPRLCSGQTQGGVALLEVLVAILIFSVGILSLVGMQATAKRYATDAEFRSLASYLASQRIAEAWVADRTLNLVEFAESGTVIGDLPNGTRTTAVSGDATTGYVVTVTVNWMIPGDSVTHALTSSAEIHDRCDTATCT